MAVPRTWVVGEVVTAALLNAEIRDQLNALLTVQTASIVKSSSTSRTSTTTLAADPHIVLAVAANTAYLLDGFFEYDGAFGAGDLKLDWTVPASATLRWAALGTVAADTTQKFNSSSVEAGVTTLSIGTYGVGSTRNACAPRGYLTTGATAGNLTLTWAQNASNATATTLRAGSWARILRRV
ncbi:hypothetical protein ACFWCB_26400 [Streptomyces sp. NPDC060048]|uniref:hypothetical protein n=1 Tax=unclassified Streptomyces TaxID=2593676 RepID=UPI0036751F7D